MRARRKPEEIVGVVHSLGACGGCAGNETLWTPRFSFSAWRGPDGQLDECRLHIRRPGLRHEKLQEMMDSIKPYMVLRVRVSRTTARSAAMPWAPSW
jgi:hypothetical protein